MKTWMSATLSLALSAAVALTALGTPLVAEAKRLGSGKSQGMQRDMPARTAPDAAPAKPAQPAATPGTPAAAGAAAAAAPGKRSWMGPLAGLAAGLGLAALFSHLGMGEGLANFMMLALLAVAAFFLVRFLLARFGSRSGRTPALAGAGAQGGPLSAGAPRNEPVIQRTMVDERPAQFKPAPMDAPTPPAMAPIAAAEPAAAKVSAAFVPASFDSDGFARIAKMIFIRMQTANDAADLDDLRRFTTPEMFSTIRLEILERGSAPQTTDVVRVDAQVLDVAEEAGRQIVSVRFLGEVIEEKGSAPTAFNEVWHLVKPSASADEGGAWSIAGIEQAG